MRQVLNIISAGFFCAVYLTVSLAWLIGPIQMPAISSGPKTITTGRPLPKEKPKIVWTQRSHTPAEKQVSLSAEAWVSEQFPTWKDHGILLPVINRTSSYPLLHFDKSSTRAPPLA